MPTYVFSEGSFIDFAKRNVEGNVAVVSSDVMDVDVEEMETHLGKKKVFVVKFAVSSEVFNLTPEEFDDLIKYAVIFVDKDDLSEEGKRALR